MRPSSSAARLGACMLFYTLLACRAEPPLRAPAPLLQYVELVTQGADPDSALPLLVVLHGLGDSPEHIAPLFQELSPATRIVAPRAPDAWGEGTSWYPIDERPSAIIRARAAMVAALIAHVQTERKTRGKPVVTGFSQGGVLSFVLAAEHGEAIAAALPIAGYLPADITPKKRAGGPLRIRAFHGHDDVRIPYAEAERSVQVLRSAGFDVALRGYPALGHAISSAMQTAIFVTLRPLLTQ